MCFQFRRLFAIATKDKITQDKGKDDKTNIC